MGYTAHFIKKGYKAMIGQVVAHLNFYIAARMLVGFGSQNAGEFV